LNFNIIVAVDKKLGIGKNNALPWHLPGDLKHFKQITSRAEEGKKNALIMGRKTWDSLPEKVKPLPGRLNIIVSRAADYEVPESCRLANSLDQALQLCAEDSTSDVFVIGGAQLYDAALKHKALKRVYLTEIDEDFHCDVFFPAFADLLKLTSGAEAHQDNGIAYTFKILEPESRQLAKCQVD
jgi:dihydrofolate reductase